MCDLVVEHDTKINIEHNDSFCMCCLSTGRRVFNVLHYKQALWEFAGIEISDSDSLPKVICYECCALLEKSFRFRQKIQRAHVVLYDYSTRCAPFPISADDPELCHYQTPQLVMTCVLQCDNGKSKNGFHKVLEHKKRPIESELAKVELPLVEVPTNQEPNIKCEDDLFEYEDNIPLYEYKSNISRISDEDLASLLESDILQIKEDSPPISKKRKRTKKDKKEKKSKRARLKSTKDTSKSSLRTPIDIDLNKIKIIDLDPQEQMRQLKEDSMREGYSLPFTCKLCYKGFNFECKLENHMKKHSPSRGAYKCDLCEMYLPTKHSLGVHMLIHTRRYECRKCGRRMIDRASIVTHYKSQHEGMTPIFTCHVCGKMSSNSKTHRGHVRNHHAAPRPECALCRRSFVNNDSLTEHLLIHQSIKNHKCPHCEMSFRTSSQLRLHRATHDNTRLYYCVECDVRFKTSSALGQHLRKSLKHVDQQSFKFVCQVCAKRFSTAALLNNHHSIQHLKRRIHTCPICEAKLATVASLNKHVAGHKKPERREAKHICHTCGNAFTSLYVLKNHSRLHTGEKPFECTRCGRRFTQRTALHTHVKLVHLKVQRNTKVKPELLSGLMNIKPEIEEDDQRKHTKLDAPEILQPEMALQEVKPTQEVKMNDKMAPLLVYDDAWTSQNVSEVYFSLAQDATRTD